MLMCLISKSHNLDKMAKRVFQKPASGKVQNEPIGCLDIAFRISMAMAGLTIGFILIGSFLQGC